MRLYKFLRRLRMKNLIMLIAIMMLAGSAIASDWGTCWGEAGVKGEDSSKTDWYDGVDADCDGSEDDKKAEGGVKEKK